VRILKIKALSIKRLHEIKALSIVNYSLSIKN
jgi:hypothetical protein